MLAPTKQAVLGIWAIAGLIITLGFLAYWLGLRINLTPSMPLGLYRAKARILSQPLQQGTLVLFCPPDTPALQLALNRQYIGTGSCPNHAVPLLKPVAAVAGDTVELSVRGVRINQAWLPNSQISSQDSAGRLLPHWPFSRYTVRTGEVWLVSTYSVQSYDSRYFGPINESRITTTATPLWIGD